MTKTMRLLVLGVVAPLLAACGGEEESAGGARQIDMAAAGRGEILFRRCGACHWEGIGPTLNDVYGRQIASVEGFEYSEAFAAADVVWSEETLTTLLTEGDTFLPGSNMVITPLTEQEARDVIEYLRRLSR